MENSKIPYRSSSAKIDKIVCKLVIFTKDLSQATQRTFKIADNEYFRALKIHQPARTPAKANEPPNQALYYMDKLIRERLKKGSYGYDNSKLLNLQQDLRENSQILNDSSLFMQKLKQESNVKSAGLTHNDWLRQKNAAERIKNKLKLRIQREYTENQLRNDQIEEENKLESQIEVEKWEKNKIKEARKEKKQKKREKTQKIMQDKAKEKMAEEAYREWLKDKIRKQGIENEKKIKQRKIEKIKMEQDRIKEAEFKLKCEHAYSEWLEKNKVGSKYCFSRKSSLGKKKIGSEQVSYYLSI